MLKTQIISTIVCWLLHFIPLSLSLTHSSMWKSRKRLRTGQLQISLGRQITRQNMQVIFCLEMLKYGKVYYSEQTKDIAAHSLTPQVCDVRPLQCQTDGYLPSCQSITVLPILYARLYCSTDRGRCAWAACPRLYSTVQRVRVEL